MFVCLLSLVRASDSVASPFPRKPVGLELDSASRQKYNCDDREREREMGPCSPMLLRDVPRRNASENGSSGTVVKERYVRTVDLLSSSSSFAGEATISKPSTQLFALYNNVYNCWVVELVRYEVPTAQRFPTRRCDRFDLIRRG